MKNNVLIRRYLYLQPFLDVIAAIIIYKFSFLPNISLIVRGLFLGICFIYLMKSNNKIIKFYSIITSTYLFLYVLYILIFKSDYLIYEITNTIKTFYCTYSILFLIVEYNNNITVKDFRYLLTIYLSFILIPNILGIGFDSYEVTKYGSIGLFYSANDTSIILCLLLPIIVLDTIKYKKIHSIILLILIFISSLIIGTKSILLSIIIIIFTLILFLIYNLFKHKKYKTLFILFNFIIVGTIGMILIIPKTNFYKNIVIHREFLGIDSFDDIFKFETFDHFVFSERLTFLNQTYDIYKNSNTIEKFIGLGYVKGNNNYIKKIEMDFFDVFYGHGLIGFSLFYLPIIHIVKNIYIGYSKKRKSLENILIIMNIFLMLLLSIIVGHTFTSPSVSFIASLILIKYYYHVKTNKMLAN